jgi:hypothetical protein
MRERAVKTADAFNPQAVANLMWALATMGLGADEGLARAMRERAVKTADAFNPQAVANLMWSLAVSGADPLLVWSLALGHVEAFRAHAVCGAQVHQALLSVRLRQDWASRMGSGVTDVMAQHGAVWRAAMAQADCHSSRLQVRSPALQRMLVPWSLEMLGRRKS